MIPVFTEKEMDNMSATVVKNGKTNADLADINSSPLFALLKKNKEGKITSIQLLEYLKKEGILLDDPRLQKAIELLGGQESEYNIQAKELQGKDFDQIVRCSVVVKNALTQNQVIPDFEDFCKDIEEIFHQVAPNKGGAVADYIPQLARVNPEQWAVSICTIDGQRFSIGDAHTQFCLQSTCKPINYCLAIEEHGIDVVHKHVGREPSGRSFNELSLNQKGLPHNPLINAGAIMGASLIKPKEDIADRFEYVSNTWSQLCANKPVNFNNSVYLSERQTADRNFALAYFMREHNAFPEKTDLIETLELYFQCCSIESQASDLSIAAATLANAGVNPLTGERIFNEKTVQHCMSLMLSCGMYDFSGEFAFNIGLPAKSGVSGALFLVIPNVMGMSIWSPRLDAMGNSVRGVEFCARLVEKFNFHHYDNLNSHTSKKDPRIRKYESTSQQFFKVIWAASNGDLDAIKRMQAEGVNLAEADYDGRTALHLAAAENQIEVVEYLLNQNVPLQPKDRWGGTPLDDAKRGKHKEMVLLLKKALTA